MLDRSHTPKNLAAAQVANRLDGVKERGFRGGWRWHGNSDDAIGVHRRFGQAAPRGQVTSETTKSILPRQELQMRREVMVGNPRHNCTSSPNTIRTFGPARPDSEPLFAKKRVPINGRRSATDASYAPPGLGIAIGSMRGVENRSPNVVISLPRIRHPAVQLRAPA
jgi:hypothetical protein